MQTPSPLPVVCEIMHFVFLLPLLARKHQKPLMSQAEAHTDGSNAHLPPDVKKIPENPLKVASKDKLLPELICRV